MTFRSPLSTFFLVPLFGLSACTTEGNGSRLGDEETTRTKRQEVIAIAPLRSLAVSEKAIMETFHLEELLQQLIDQAGVAGQSPKDLFRSWAALNDECDEVIDGATVNESFNGFSFECRPGESPFEQEPFSIPTPYEASALFNRFDLAPADGANCGEYRIVFARDAVDASSRKNLIFEAVLPNPDPTNGLEGCRPVVDFWAGLSAIDSLSERAALLKGFYFDGLPGFAPVVHVDHYRRGPDSGQVRTNSFLNQPWSLREFSVEEDCSSGCEVVFVQAPVVDTPYFKLSGDTSGEPLAQAYQDWFIDSLTPGEGILSEDLGAVASDVPEQFLVGESQIIEFIGAPTPPSPNIADEMSVEFAQRVDGRLAELGVAMTAEQVINRADAATCVGCHRSANGDDVGGGQSFPSSLGFRQVGEFQSLNQSPDGSAFELSSAILNTFLPERQTKMEAFLAAAPAEEMSVSVKVNSEWGRGYCAEVTVNNESDSALGWEVQLDLGSSTFGNGWSAMYDTSSRPILATPPAWSTMLAASGSTSFGFCAIKGVPYAPPSASVTHH